MTCPIGFCGIQLENTAATCFNMSEISTAAIGTHAPLFVAGYGRNRATGSAILIDEVSNATVAACLIAGGDVASMSTATGASKTIWLTGLSGAGKSTIANLLASCLRNNGVRVEVLDGDVLRTTLCKDLGFSREDREENIRRIGYLCELLNRHGVVAIVAAISPYRAVRDEVRAKVAHFIEVHVTCPLDTLITRDPKGLYKRAIAGEIAHFTGISDPYEPPTAPELIIDTSQGSPEQAVETILGKLE